MSVARRWDEQGGSLRPGGERQSRAVGRPVADETIRTRIYAMEVRCSPFRCELVKVYCVMKEFVNLVLGEETLSWGIFDNRFSRESVWIMLHQFCTVWLCSFPLYFPLLDSYSSLMLPWIALSKIPTWILVWFGDLILIQLFLQYVSWVSDLIWSSNKSWQDPQSMMLTGLRGGDGWMCIGVSRP